MADKYIEALAQGINAFYNRRRLGNADRQLKLFLYLGQGGPETVSGLAARIVLPKTTVYEDLRALGGGAPAKRGAHLIEEIPPVRKGLPSHYRPSKRGQKLLDEISTTMQMAMDTIECPSMVEVPYGSGYYDEDEPLDDWMATRSFVRG